MSLFGGGPEVQLVYISEEPDILRYVFGIAPTLVIRLLTAKYCLINVYPEFEINSKLMIFVSFDLHPF